MTMDEPVPGAAGSEPQEPGTPEQTEQQKIDQLMDKLRQVNEQLGRKVAIEVKLDKDRACMVFPVAYIDAGGELIYGLDSKMGPVKIRSNPDLRAKLAEVSSGELLPSALQGRVSISTLFPIDNEQGMENWQRAFEASKMPLY